MLLPKSPTYYLVMESYVAAIRKGSMHSSSKEIVTTLGYERIDDTESFKIYQDITVIVQGLVATLPINEAKMALLIIDELHMNNALWYHEPKDSRDYKTIKGLIDKGILHKTEDKNIFLVNPYNIRRGTIPSVLAMTMEHLSTSSKVHKALIHDLRYNKALVNNFELLNANNQGLIMPSNTSNNT